MTPPPSASYLFRRVAAHWLPVGCGGLRQRRQQMIELVPGAYRLGCKITPVVGVDRPVQRYPATTFDSRLCQPIELGGIVGEQLYPRAAEDLQHTGSHAVVTLVVIEAQGDIGVERVKAVVLQFV